MCRIVLMNLVNMVKDKKKRLFEVFERVTGVKVNEQYNDDYGKALKAPKGIGDFNAIDWQTLFDDLMVNTRVINAGGTSTEKNLAATVNDLTDTDSMLSPEELQHLEDFDLININGTFPNIGGQYPIIEDRKYRNFNAFKIKAAEIWNKKAPVQQTGNDSEAPYLRGREEQMNEKSEENNSNQFSMGLLNSPDNNTDYSNKELRTFIADLLWKLKYYDKSLAADIITAALEEKYPQFKVMQVTGRKKVGI